MKTHQRINNAINISSDIFLRNFVLHCLVFGIYSIDILFLSLFVPWIAIHLAPLAILAKTYMVGFIINIWIFVAAFFYNLIKFK